MLTNRLQVVREESDREDAALEACQSCGRPLRITFQKVRPHRTKPGMEMYEVFARCTRPLSGHRFVSWVEFDPRKTDTLPLPRFVAEG